MTPARMKTIRMTAGLTISEMARILNLQDPVKVPDDPDRMGRGADRVRQMEAGRREISGPVERILQLVEAGKFPIDEALGEDKPMRHAHLYRMERRRWLAEIGHWRAICRREGHNWLHGDWQYFESLRERGPDIRKRYQL